MKIGTLGRWLYTLMLATTMISMGIVLYFTGPHLEDAVLGRRLEVADTSDGMIYSIQMKGLTLYGTRSEWLMDIFNHTAFFAFFGLIAIGMIFGQITYRGQK